jgi:hypothetical protein
MDSDFDIKIDQPPMDSPLPEPEPMPAIGFSFQRQLTDHASLVFQNHVPANCSDAYLNDRLDKLARAAHRQWAVACLPERYRQLKIAEGHLEKLEADLEASEINERNALLSWQAEHHATDRRGEWKPSPAQRQEQVKLQASRSTAASAIVGKRNEIEQIRIMIEEMEAAKGRE